MKKIHIQYYKNQGFELIIGVFELKLCLLDFVTDKDITTYTTKLKKKLNAELVEYEDEITKETKKQLDEYFTQKREEFTIPLLFIGTEFQESVWNTLLKIPYGETISYKQQSKMINKEKAIRAVASANGKNSIGIIVPCHRVIGSDGSLTGYAGGVDIKKRLLEIEGVL
jgi:methylated-DNA-[protein]-cysteine S-methyltransferase